MSTNPYAPPLAPVEDTTGSDAPMFFAVATWKVVLMCLVTLGLYQLYWFYENWRLVRARDRSNILPVPRAIFGLFYCYSMFKRIRDDGKALGLPKPPEAGALATLWIVSSIAWRLPGPWGLLGVVSWFAVLPIQAYANRINAQAAPAADRNARLSWLNWIAVVIGGAFFGLVLAALISPPAEV